MFLLFEIVLILQVHSIEKGKEKVSLMTDFLNAWNVVVVDL